MQETRRNGRLQRWPPLAKGFCLALGTGFAALLAYGGYYRALAGGATISGDRPVRREFERSWPRARGQSSGDAREVGRGGLLGSL